MARFSKKVTEMTKKELFEELNRKYKSITASAVKTIEVATNKFDSEVDIEKWTASDEFKGLYVRTINRGIDIMLLMKEITKRGYTLDLMDTEMAKNEIGDILEAVGM